MDRSTLDELVARWVDAFNRDDIDTLANIYAENAKVMPPGLEMMTGRSAAHQFWTTAKQQMGVRNPILKTIDLESEGNLAYETGSYELSIQPEGREPMVDVGKYLVVWKRQDDGSWKMAADIWNSNQAPPPV
jgi:ketosteroid isomerase-like protein